MGSDKPIFREVGGIPSPPPHTEKLYGTVCALKNYFSRNVTHFRSSVPLTYSLKTSDVYSGTYYYGKAYVLNDFMR